MTYEYEIDNRINMKQIVTHLHFASLTDFVTQNISPREVDQIIGWIIFLKWKTLLSSLPNRYIIIHLLTLETFMHLENYSWFSVLTMLGFNNWNVLMAKFSESKGNALLERATPNTAKNKAAAINVFWKWTINENEQNMW